ncbi:unnamed protein product [Anisakis simplex]|uniref:Ovule protein n=1 Tax=Anisakis simplex TaxID=6269 RepID=A0A0M3JQN2_ANISI|nr:unnamed protein product [Anisakis simplex]
MANGDGILVLPDEYGTERLSAVNSSSQMSRSSSNRFQVNHFESCSSSASFRVLNDCTQVAYSLGALERSL